MMVSYATGNRGVDDPGTGPGMMRAWTILSAAGDAGIRCFSGLHVKPGEDWQSPFMQQLKTQCKVLLVLQDRAFYRSLVCLEEVCVALQSGVRVLKVNVEPRDELPSKTADKWVLDRAEYEAKGTLDRYAELERMRHEAREAAEAHQVRRFGPAATQLHISPAPPGHHGRRRQPCFCSW